MKPPIKPTAHQVDHYQILSVLFKRYAELAQKHAAKLDGLPAKCQSASLISLCNEAIANGKDYPFDKMNRWLGFAQGVLATTGIIDVDAEREFTRPLLHQLHLEPVKSWPRKQDE
jgi:hypothetical protein